MKTVEDCCNDNENENSKEWEWKQLRIVEMIMGMGIVEKKNSLDRAMCLVGV